MKQRFETDCNNIIFEAIETELVVINLKSGCYYSLNESASAIWKLVIEGYSIQEISELFTKHYPSSTNAMSEEIAGIISEFVHEEFIRESSAPTPSSAASVSPGDLALPEHFRKPVMTKHSDIQEMLQLDPIHEVTELGWPHKKMDAR